MRPKSEGNCVYKYESDGEIIYIGKSDCSLVDRIRSHAKESKFKEYPNVKIYYCKLANKGESDALETLLINKYKPVLNVAKKYNGKSIDIADPEWKPYKTKEELKAENIEKARKESERLEKFKKASAEMLKELDKTNEKCKKILKEYSEASDKAHELTLQYMKLVDDYRSGK